jgi:hypothetical protein
LLSLWFYLPETKIIYCAVLRKGSC